MSESQEDIGKSLSPVLSHSKVNRKKPAGRKKIVSKSSVIANGVATLSVEHSSLEGSVVNKEKSRSFSVPQVPVSCDFDNKSDGEIIGFCKLGSGEKIQVNSVHGKLAESLFGDIFAKPNEQTLDRPKKYNYLKKRDLKASFLDENEEIGVSQSSTFVNEKSCDNQIPDDLDNKLDDVVPVVVNTHNLEKRKRENSLETCVRKKLKFVEDFSENMTNNCTNVKKSVSDETLLEFSNNYSDLSIKGTNIEMELEISTGSRTLIANNSIADTPSSAPCAQNVSDNSPKTDPVLGFTTGLGKSIEISADQINKAAQRFKVCEELEDETLKTLSSSASNDVIKRTKNMNNDTRNSFNINGKSGIIGLSTGSGKPIRASTKVNHLFKNCNNLNELTDSKNVKNTINESSVLDNFERDVFKNKTKIDLSSFENKLAKGKSLFSDMNFDDVPFISNTFGQTFTLNASSSALGTSKSNVSTPRTAKTSLKSQPFSLSSNKLAPSTSIFGDMDFSDLMPSKRSTPFKLSHSTPIRNTNKGQSILFDLTPIKPINCNSLSKTEVAEVADSHVPLCFQKPTQGDLLVWEEALNAQRVEIEKKLACVETRLRVLQEQKQHFYHKVETPRSQGVLFKQKENLHRNAKLSLIDVAKLESETSSQDDIVKFILRINPQNAEFVHFSCVPLQLATVSTSDGCTIIPNLQGKIGLSEVEPAFYAMSGIKKELISKEWIRNHYKWIVWKLASYERYFPGVLSGCFSINNVIKQLKYRYNREIDNAERSCLMKMYELDDIPQKRMILCVSNIIKHDSKTELELTDGWYSIRATLDEPLIRQVDKRNIQIGDKLILSGSELLNCQGCHPLETDSAQACRLRIFFNSTRKAHRFAKLGYQKIALPFVLPLSSIDCKGGTIGCSKLFVARMYPSQFMEKMGTVTTWRNQKAELKRNDEIANEMENNNSVEKSYKDNKRKVIQVLKLTVLDFYKEDSKFYKLTFWNPNDFDLENLRENHVFIFHNITMRSQIELNTITKTKYKHLSEATSNFGKFKRKFTAIDAQENMLADMNFNEFDTVGIVIEKKIQKFMQHIWLTNVNKKVLLVRISEGSDTCTLLEGFNRGDIVGLSNLHFYKSSSEFVQAYASQTSVISNYPKQNYLKDEIKIMESIKKGNRTIFDEILQETEVLVEKWNEDLQYYSTSCKLSSDINISDTNK